MLRTLIPLAGVFAVIGAAAAADLASLPVLTLDGAKHVAAAAAGEAQRLQAPGGSIAVVDTGGNLLYLERRDGSFPASAHIAEGKAHTAAVFRRATKDFEDIVNTKHRTTMVALPDFTPLAGGVPLVADGQVVGAVGVSGAASADQDEQIARAGAAAFAAK